MSTNKDSTYHTWTQLSKTKKDLFVSVGKKQWCKTQESVRDRNLEVSSDVKKYFKIARKTRRPVYAVYTKGTDTAGISDAWLSTSSIAQGS